MSDGRLVFEVSDPFRPDNDGRYELVVEDGAGSCARTEAEPDLSRTVNLLGATYLGGTSFGQLAAAGQVEERASTGASRAPMRCSTGRPRPGRPGTSDASLGRGDLFPKATPR